MKLLPALIGTVAAFSLGGVPAPVCAAPPTPTGLTLPPLPVNEITTRYARRYRIIRAALKPETRRAVLALVPGIADAARAARYSNVREREREAMYNVPIKKRFRRLSPVQLDILTVYVMLEILLPDGDYAATVIAEATPEGDWRDAPHQRYTQFLMASHFPLGREDVLLADLLAATSDAPAPLIGAIR